jgi:signal transduction histidine kinase/CheY-like chemotaxis protein
VLLAFMQAAQARENVIVLEDGKFSYDLAGRVLVLVDKDRSLRPSDMFSGAADERFITPQNRELNYSFSRSAYWVRFTVENRARHVERWVLKIPYPVIDSAVLYCRDETGGIVEMKNGDSLPFHERPIASNNLAYLLTQKAGSTQTYYLKVTSNNSIVIPMEILSAREFARKSSTEQLVLGFYYGLLFIMVLYSLMLFISVKDPSYLLYSALTSCMIIYFMSLHGHTYVFLWPDSPAWGDLAPVLFMGSGGLFLLLFVRRYFDISRYGRPLDTVIKVIFILLSGVIAASFVMDRIVTNIVMSICVVAALIVSFTAGIILMTKKVRHAKAFTITWMIFIIGALLHALRGFSILTNYRGILGFTEVSYAVAQLFFTMSIVYRIDSEKEEKLAAQAALLEKMKLIDESEEEFGRRLKSDRMKSISVFAGGIAHDFNNLLTAILGNISITKSLAGVPEQAHRFLSDAEKASLQAKNLTAQLLSFTRGGEPVRQIVAIAGMLADIAKLSLSGTNVRGEFDIADGLWGALVNEGQVHQAIQNLVLNARESMPAGGTVEICARNMTVETPNEFGLCPGPYVCISVRDHGIGIPADKLGEIFFPYFTTKKTGSGLGLAVCYSVVNRHGGHIGVRSAPGEGSEFTVYLPAGMVVAEEKSAPAAEVMLDGRSVLIMDDEGMVLDIGERMLVKLGLEVTRARNGEEAIRHYLDSLANGHAFDAVILDLTVRGGMGGGETVGRLLEIDPGARVIASSGYATDPIMANFAEYGFAGVLPKPYRFDEMQEVMSRIFHG